MAKLRVPVTPLDHILGDDSAPVTVVEYGDYECPHCAAAQPVVADILLRLGDRLRFVYRHFPMVEVHPVAGPAAQAAEFAGSRGLFWQMHQSIFVNLRDALASGTFAEKVRGDFISGVRSGVNGTPSFFVNGIRHDSPYGVATLASAIDQAILAVAA
jgi:protein-disulfide isomerase